MKNKLPIFEGLYLLTSKWRFVRLLLSTPHIYIYITIAAGLGLGFHSTSLFNSPPSWGIRSHMLITLHVELLSILVIDFKLGSSPYVQ